MGRQSEFSWAFNFTIYATRKMSEKLDGHKN